MAIMLMITNIKNQIRSIFDIDRLDWSENNQKNTKYSDYIRITKNTRAERIHTEQCGNIRYTGYFDCGISE